MRLRSIKKKKFMLNVTNDQGDLQLLKKKERKQQLFFMRQKMTYKSLYTHV